MGKLIDADAAIDFVGSMNMCDEISNEACKKLTSYLDELPSAEPYTTTHDSIPAETGKNDGDRTSGDCISRQAVTKFLNDWLSCLFENCHKQSASDLKMIIKDFKNLPSAQSDDDRLERCRFEYVNACKVLAHRTPDTRKKDIADAYAVVRALNPIFGEEGF